MTATPLVDCATLADHLEDPEWVILDCRFDLRNPMAGREAWTEGHIPGAHYADLETELSGPVIPGTTGRHPLPGIGELGLRCTVWGIGSDRQVVAYDDSGGCFAARAWWLLNWAGHSKVAVLDGGWSQWLREGRPIDTAPPTPRCNHFVPRIQAEWVVTSEEMVQALERGRVLLDARTSDRFAGLDDPIDPVPGRIPRARNLPWHETVCEDLRLMTPHDLDERFAQALGDSTDTTPPIAYCGSGVTACSLALAWAQAGRSGIMPVYAGSWSEWITDESRPIERDPASDP